MCSFCSKARPKNVKRRESERSRKWLPWIFDVVDFDPKNSKVRFFKSKYPINPKLSIYLKTAIYVIGLHTKNTHAKFQINISVLGCAMANEPGICDDVTF